MTPPPQGRFAALAEHVRRYLIAYVIISVGLGVGLGAAFSGFSAAGSRTLLSNLVIAFAILTIYPSMVQMKTEGLARGFRSWKQITNSVLYV